MTHRLVRSPRHNTDKAIGQHIARYASHLEDDRLVRRSVPNPSHVLHASGNNTSMSRRPRLARMSMTSAHQWTMASNSLRLTGATLSDSLSLSARARTATAPALHPTPTGVQSLLIGSTAQALAVRPHGLAFTVAGFQCWASSAPRRLVRSGAFPLLLTSQHQNYLIFQGGHCLW